MNLQSHASHRSLPAVASGQRQGMRQGSALLLVLVMTVALAALALSAIFLGSTTSLVGKAQEREREFRYAAEGALAMGRSRLTRDAALVIPDSGARQLLAGEPFVGADGRPVPGVTLNLWLARTGSKTGQHGLYASVIAEAVDSRGGDARFVRRLELMEENFARFLDWSDRTMVGCYGSGEVMNGPVWSNGNIGVCGGRFRDTVAAVGSIGTSGTFEMGRYPGQSRIDLPSLARLSRLEGYAGAGNFSFDAPTNGDVTTARMRIEFMHVDLNGDGDAVGDRNEGFFRVFTASDADENRADYRSSSNGSVHADQCGDWHYEQGRPKFYPVSVHDQGWFRDSMVRYMSENRTELGYAWTTATHVQKHQRATGTETNSDQRARIMQMTGRAAVATALTPRCYPAGDPHLVAVERRGGGYSAGDWEKGGEDSTFTAHTTTGDWMAWSGPAVNWGGIPGAANLPAAGMRAFLFPIDRTLNPGTRDVIYVNGTVAVHGTLRGRITLYSSAEITMVDDLRYSVSPFSDDCDDMLGIIAARDVTIADNAINTPQNPKNPGDSGPFVFMDDDTDFHLDGVIMALGTLVPERYSQAGPRGGGGSNGPGSCNGNAVGRGCFYQVGGAIVRNREATYTGNPGTGYMEVRDYDRRMMRDSPPYFPTTGRYFDNRFYEIDPLDFDIDEYLRRVGQSGS